MPIMEDWQLKERLSFAQHFNSGLLLSLGCGPGRDTRLFTDLGLTCVGLDFSIEMLRYGKGVFVCADMAEIPFRSDTFDGVWSCSAMKYLPRDKMSVCLTEVRRVLKDRGLFWLGLEEGEGLRVEDRHGVKLAINLYEEKALTPLFEKAGFKIFEEERIRTWKNYINFLLEAK